MKSFKEFLLEGNDTEGELNIPMDYMAKYYKNLSEKLETELNLLEANFRKAMRAGHKNPHLVDKAIVLQKLRDLKARDAYSQLFDEKDRNKQEKGPDWVLNDIKLYRSVDDAGTKAKKLSDNVSRLQDKKMENLVGKLRTKVELKSLNKPVDPEWGFDAYSNYELTRPHKNYPM